MLKKLRVPPEEAKGLPEKLPLLKQSLSLMLSQLSPEDQVAIVTYAGSAGQVLAPTSASERATILGAWENLSAGGSTAGQAGLQQAYSVAEGMAARSNDRPATVTLEHSSGVIDVLVDYNLTADGIDLRSAGLVRTARLLAKGEVMIPRSVWAK